jgi:hypothetical protein
MSCSHYEIGGRSWHRPAICQGTARWEKALSDGKQKTSRHKRRSYVSSRDNLTFHNQLQPCKTGWIFYCWKEQWLVPCMLLNCFSNSGNCETYISHCTVTSSHCHEAKTKLSSNDAAKSHTRFLWEMDMWKSQQCLTRREQQWHRLSWWGL